MVPNICIDAIIRNLQKITALIISNSIVRDLAQKSYQLNSAAFTGRRGKEKIA